MPAALVEWVTLLPGETDDSHITWFAAVGGLMSGRGMSQLLARENGLDTVFTDMLPVLQRSDLVVGNPKGAITTQGVRNEKKYTFRFKPEVLDSLKKRRIRLSGDHEQ